MKLEHTIKELLHSAIEEFGTDKNLHFILEYIEASVSRGQAGGMDIKILKNRDEKEQALSEFYKFREFGGDEEGWSTERARFLQLDAVAYLKRKGLTKIKAAV